MAGSVRSWREHVAELGPYKEVVDENASLGLCPLPSLPDYTYTEELSDSSSDMDDDTAYSENSTSIPQTSQSRFILKPTPPSSRTTRKPRSPSPTRKLLVALEHAVLPIVIRQGNPMVEVPEEVSRLRRILLREQRGTKIPQALRVRASADTPR